MWSAFFMAGKSDKVIYLTVVINAFIRCTSKLENLSYMLLSMAIKGHCWHMGKLGQVMTVTCSSYISGVLLSWRMLVDRATFDS